jgi:SPX domain protein involved in polyphosphate accumulation
VIDTPSYVPVQIVDGANWLIDSHWSGGMMTSSNLSFNRKEKKSLILEHSFAEIVEEISAHIPVHSYDGNPGLLTVETTYLDTNDFMLYKEFLLKRKFRYKIRVRRYGYDGVFAPEYLVEMKVSHDSMSSKKRFVLPAECLEAFLRNEDLRSVIKEANKGLKGAQKTYKIMTELIRINRFVPVLQTSYQRIAFQKKSKRVRITVDNGITHKQLLGKAKTETLDAIVLETKIIGKTPKWHKKMVNKLSLLQQQRFSKYATGINALYYPERGKYNFTKEGVTIDPEIPQRIKDSFDVLKSVLKLENTSLYEA